jgi:hypothetical protein
MIVMPVMSAPQVASWYGIMELHERLNHGWTLIGGQMVHLHCAERGYAPPRPTDDVDTVVDVRTEPGILLAFTEALAGLGFSSRGVSPQGIEHRWVRDAAVIDVLLPDGVGSRAGARRGVTGSPTIETPGGSQALERTESVSVSVDGREGKVRRPNLVGALVMKAAAHTAVGAADRRRHRSDFAALAALIAARDFRGAELNKKDRQRLRAMVAATRSDGGVMSGQSDAAESLNRLERAALL